MRMYRTAKISLTSLLLAAGGLAATSMPAAAQPAPSKAAAATTSHTAETLAASKEGCDLDWHPVDLYLVTGTETEKGRTVELKTGSGFDWWAHSYAYDIAEGDKVYIQRSLKPFEMKKDLWYPSKWDVEHGAGGGITSCRNIASWYDANVNDFLETGSMKLQTYDDTDNHSYAVRSCIKPTNGKFNCTKWTVDHYEVSP
jgi:hypothetical protein